MKQLRLAVGAAASALVVCVTPLTAQEGFPLAPNAPRGQPVAPFFEGWFLNPDGSYTLSFGYFNVNTREVPEIPIGENNWLEPAELNGNQPTSFPPRREQGVFAVRIPPDMADRDVVWTITHNGQSLSVPGRIGVPAYELGYRPMAMGSLPPNMRLRRDGPVGTGVPGITSDQPMTASVGTPLPVTVWIDDSRSQRDPVALNVRWFKHSGPGTVTFEPEENEDVESGEATVQATFSAPGEYVLRARADNHNANDSSPGDQCCWTNGYISVNVTQ